MRLVHEVRGRRDLSESRCCRSTSQSCLPESCSQRPAKSISFDELEATHTAVLVGMPRQEAPFEICVFALKLPDSLCGMGWEWALRRTCLESRRRHARSRGPAEEAVHVLASAEAVPNVLASHWRAAGRLRKAIVREAKEKFIGDDVGLAFLPPLHCLAER